MILPHLLREVSWRSLFLAFFHYFPWTRMWIPLPFFPKQKPRNLKFRIANTLTVRLFSRFTLSFNVSSRYFVLLSSRRYAARSLFASSTISSAYRIHGTPRLWNSQSNSFRYTFAKSGDPSSVSVTTPFSITPLFRYRFTICMTLSSFTCFLSRFSRIVWFSVSKYFDRSRTTALV